jgi:hypothetical protein
MMAISCRSMLVLCLLVAVNVQPVRADFSFPDFSSTADLGPVGTADAGGGKLSLTTHEQCVRGAVWHATKQHIACGFTTEFLFEITIAEGTKSADGFAFVVQNDSRDAIGGVGGAMGYGRFVGECTAGDYAVLPGIPNSLAVEFDTWENRELLDPDDNHVAVHCCGTNENRADTECLLSEAALKTMLPLFSDTGPHTARVTYVPGLLEVELDGQLVLSIPDLDLATLLELDDGRAWIGFTAATGLVREQHEILAWSFTEGACVPAGARFVRGDTNADGQYSVSDAIVTVRYLFGLGSALTCHDAADANDDGRLNVADAVTVLSYLFGSAPVLPAPGPECGGDATTDGLSCEDYPPCP